MVRQDAPRRRIKQGTPGNKEAAEAYARMISGDAQFRVVLTM
jgi:hypothetical protein